MVAIGGGVDFVDGVNHVHHILHGDALVGTQHHSSLVVFADVGVDEAGELLVVGRRLVHEILVLRRGKTDGRVGSYIVRCSAV